MSTADNSPEELKRRIIAEVDEAISAVIGRHAGDLMTGKWVALVEVIDGQASRRMLWILAPEEVTAWDSLGMLGYSWQVEQGQTVADQIGD